MNALQTAKEYYTFFNSKNWQGMLDLLHPDVKHEANQGDTRVGKQLFTEFLAHMDTCYDEKLTDMVFFSEESNTRVAVEFVVNGIYKSTDSDLPEAKGQKYVLPAGAFLEIKDGLIYRITTYNNLPLWMELVEA
ncbi:MAG: nuclear transport factor 2 family protein [Fluviicola sp.]